MPTHTFRRIALAAVLVLLAAAPTRAQPTTAKPIVVFAAASLKNALDAAVADWMAATGRRVTVAYAASSALARQIEQGAPADVFISADLDWMDWAAERKLIRPDTRRVLLTNTLVLITPADGPTAFKLAKGADLGAALGAGRLAIGQVQSVPAGKYAKEALEALGLWAGVAARLAQADSVRAALALVARGEAPFGIVYATDAGAEPRVKVVDTFPADTHAPIVYPAAVTTASANPDAAAFFDHLRSPTGTAIFARHGFSVPVN